MDEIAKYNLERWKALAEANALWTQPWQGLDADTARNRLDPDGLLGDVRGKRVLCLASGGGQQAPAFALLGARVISFDLSEAQLQRDRKAAEHYGVYFETVQGDMRDLSSLDKAAFDVVYHGHSLNFVPDARVVFREVVRVLRRNGIYHFSCHNPFFMGLKETDWNGKGYTLKQHFLEGTEITSDDSEWVYDRSKRPGPIHGPREYRHTLGALVNGLVEQGFVILHVNDAVDVHPNPNAEPGTWDHFVSIAPPWLGFWACYRPHVTQQIKLRSLTSNL